jgi:hypothetical protein
MSLGAQAGRKRRAVARRAEGGNMSGAEVRVVSKNGVPVAAFTTTELAADCASTIAAEAPEVELSIVSVTVVE